MTRVRVTRSIGVAVPVDEVWDLVSRFDQLPRWMPGIDAFAATPDGRVRTVLSGEATFLERLTGIDPVEHRVTYSLIHSPLDLSTHEGTIAVHSAGPNATVVDWVLDVTVDSRDPEEVRTGLRAAVDAGLEGLRAYFSAPVWARYPSLALDEDSAPGVAGWLDRRLLVPRCASCSRLHLPARPVCPYCWSDEVQHEPVSGRGVVALSITLRQGPAYPGVGYPYPVVTVELEEQAGLRFSSGLADPSRTSPIGAPVELDWVVRDAAPFPVFRPIGASA